MGILTGMGEELLFRGAVQRKFMDWLGNHHVAIWVAAAIFSAVHMQFYGFIPRMLLAALFGYLYYWSGNLWIPIIAHASNNTITILAMYFTKNMKEAKALVESNDIMPLPYVLISFMLTVGILYYFYTYTHNLRVQKT
jgi:membrane protease YdiL (CAAX protease family)